jgi:hypothetical protein
LLSATLPKTGFCAEVGVELPVADVCASMKPALASRQPVNTVAWKLRRRLTRFSATIEPGNFLAAW